MIPKTAAILTALLALGCQNPADRCELTESCPFPDLAGSDLATTQPKCAAAKGLTGDTLVCVDFSKVNGLTDPLLIGWDFTSLCPAGWEIVVGKLQVKNFGSFASSCSFTMPALSAADFQKYASYTLAVVQRVDLNSLQQKAQVMLGGDDDQKRLLDWMTGPQPRQKKVYEITKGDLPTAAMGGFQPFFKLNSAVGFGAGYQGWQIESIAVMGNP